MGLSSKTSFNMAMSFAGVPPPTPPNTSHVSMATPTRCGSVASARSRLALGQGRDLLTGEISLYKGVSGRPLGWKPKRPVAATVSKASRDAKLKKFDGAARRSVEWDGLRRDPDLWHTDGDCFVHLYGHGQSRRGPAFKVSYLALVEAQCLPLLQRFLITNNESPISTLSSGDEGSYFNQSVTKTQYELYVPAPTGADRNQAMSYHIATRNFFAWIFKRSLVGSQLGASLVGLLNSMNEFRSSGVDNIQDLLDFMDEEGYADMRSQADHALAVLFFSEHFHFKDLYIDSFAHCVGMSKLLSRSQEYETISRASRALINRAHMEMETRLSQNGLSLGTFLEDELSSHKLGLSTGARAHLDRFRSFLHSYYVAKLGYYPPPSPPGLEFSFPKHVFETMHGDFQNLYDFLADESYTVDDKSLAPARGGICVLQNLKVFNERYRHEPLRNPLPLLPEADADIPAQSLGRRLSFARNTKMRLDPRLQALSSLSKATNRQHANLMSSSIVRAYQGFEKECVFSSTKSDRMYPISAAEARKVRWLLVYCMLQTLRSTTRVPAQVRDVEHVPYHLSALTAGCPPFKTDTPYETLLRTQTQVAIGDDSGKALHMSSPGTPAQELRPDIDYLHLHIRPKHGRSESVTSFSSELSTKKGNVRRALTTLGNMPELVHPKPQRTSFHEILVNGYGNGIINGISTVSVAASSPAVPPTLAVDTTVVNSTAHTRQVSADSDISDSGFSSRWSQSSPDSISSASSVSEPHSRIGSSASLGKYSVRDLLAQPVENIAKQAEGLYTDSEKVLDHSQLAPKPLAVRKASLRSYPDDSNFVGSRTVSASYHDAEYLASAHPELDAYLRS